MALTADLNLRILVRTTGTTDISTPVDVLDTTFAQSLTTGTGANQAAQTYRVTGSAAGGGYTSYDLKGSILDSLGQAFTPAAIKGIALKNTSSEAITIGGGSNPVAAFSNAITIRPSGVLYLLAPDVTGYPITAGTADILRIGGGVGATTWQLIIIAA